MSRRVDLNEFALLYREKTFWRTLRPMKQPERPSKECFTASSFLDRCDLLTEVFQRWFLVSVLSFVYVGGYEHCSETLSAFVIRSRDLMCISGLAFSKTDVKRRWKACLGKRPCLPITRYFSSSPKDFWDLPSRKRFRDVEKSERLQRISFGRQREVNGSFPDLDEIFEKTREWCKHWLGYQVNPRTIARTQVPHYLLHLQWIRTIRFAKHIEYLSLAA